MLSHRFWLSQIGHSELVYFFLILISLYQFPFCKLGKVLTPNLINVLGR